MIESTRLATLRLDELPLNTRAIIESVDWERLGDAAKRLRELGFDDGVAVEPLHRGGIVARDPIACRVGRMTVALRRAHAEAITVRIEA